MTGADGGPGTMVRKTFGDTDPEGSSGERGLTAAVRMTAVRNSVVCVRNDGRGVRDGPAATIRFRWKRYPT